jgi:hypothetical protein
MKAIRMLPVLLFVLALAAGCGETPPSKGTPKKPSKDDAGEKKGDGHEHGSGPHGGAVGDWGGGKYHIEFTVKHPTKTARVYVLDGKAKNTVPIKAKDNQLLMTVKGVKTKDSFDVVLKADPQKDDPEGTASCFVATHEKFGVEQEFEGTVTGEFGGKSYAGDFKEEPEPEAKEKK